jgi:hypothetical protein
MAHLLNMGGIARFLGGAGNGIQVALTGLTGVRP